MARYNAAQRRERIAVERASLPPAQRKRTFLGMHRRVAPAPSPRLLQNRPSQGARQSAAGAPAQSASGRKRWASVLHLAARSAPQALQPVTHDARLATHIGLSPFAGQDERLHRLLRAVAFTLIMDFGRHDDEAGLAQALSPRDALMVDAAQHGREKRALELRRKRVRALRRARRGLDSMLVECDEAMGALRGACEQCADGLEQICG